MKSKNEVTLKVTVGHQSIIPVFSNKISYRGTWVVQQTALDSDLVWAQVVISAL